MPGGGIPKRHPPCACPIVLLYALILLSGLQEPAEVPPPPAVETPSWLKSLHGRLDLRVRNRWTTRQSDADLYQLLSLDYGDPDDNMTAFAMNKILEDITTLNTGFATVEVSESLDPRKADWNARTTRAWYNLTGKPQMQDERAFKAWVKEMKKKKKD